MAQADVGTAIGAGNDVAVKTADIVRVRSNPKDVAAIIKLSRATYRKMIQNLWWAAGYNIIALPVAAGVLYGLGILLILCAPVSSPVMPPAASQRPVETTPARPC